MTVAVIAAEGFELSGFRKVLQNIQEANLPLRFSYMGQWRGTQVVCCADGPGFRLAGRAAEAAIDRFSPDAVWSVGICGALAEDLAAGDTVTASNIVDVTSGEHYRAVPFAGCSNGVTVVSQDRVASTAEEKARLRAFGSIVEMESAGVARAAAGRGIPLCCLKVVSDTAGEEFSIDLNRARDDAGRFQPLSVLREAFRQPSSGFPELVHLFRRSRMAAERLGEFLANSQI